VFHHRRQHRRVSIRDDIAVVPPVDEAGNTVPNVVEDIEFVVDGENLVTFLVRDIDAVGIECVLERIRFIS